MVANNTDKDISSGFLKEIPSILRIIVKRELGTEKPPENT